MIFLSANIIIYNKSKHKDRHISSYFAIQKHSFYMDTILEIIKVTVPALIVYLTVKTLLTNYLNANLRIEQQKNIQQTQKDKTAETSSFGKTHCFFRALKSLSDADETRGARDQWKTIGDEYGHRYQSGI